MSDTPAASLEDGFRAAVDWLHSQDVPYVLIGGFAVGLLGRPRMTKDVDFVVVAESEQWPALLEAAQSHKLVPRITDPLAFAKKARVLLLRYEPTQTPIDVSLGLLPFEHEMIARASTQHVAGRDARVPTPEDLIILKAVANRAVDTGDIVGILQRHPDLDKQRVMFWVRQFADALERPELMATTQKLLGLS